MSTKENDIYEDQAKEFWDGALDFDMEYMDDQCPECLMVFETDEEFLSHECEEDDSIY